MSMAIKYGLQKKARMAKGDCAGPDCEGCASCKPEMMAEGGYVDDDETHAAMQLVDRIMAARKKGEPVADFKSADFDAMDQMEIPDDADYTGANSGDELGNDQEDEDRRDIVARIMRSRSKKDRMPRPA